MRCFCTHSEFILLLLSAVTSSMSSMKTSEPVSVAAIACPKP
uniref:Uncharacterized protein n=1 Tax=Anguilla anguilla TaxID=7936 RepID=A0A0E9PS29_ANGAN